jgi:hypothetical protein
MNSMLYSWMRVTFSMPLRGSGMIVPIVKDLQESRLGVTQLVMEIKDIQRVTRGDIGILLNRIRKYLCQQRTTV